MNIMNSTIDDFEMFRTGCEFADCADFCLKATSAPHPEFLFYASPAVVNAAFACEVFLKLLLRWNGITEKKIHKLKDLFEKLPVNTQLILKNSVVSRYGKWTDVWGFDYLDNVTDAFVTWRYNYEHDWSKSSQIHIDLGFLIAFRDALKELCCQSFGLADISQENK